MKGPCSLSVTKPPSQACRISDIFLWFITIFIQLLGLELMLLLEGMALMTNCL